MAQRADWLPQFLADEGIGEQGWLREWRGSYYIKKILKGTDGNVRIGTDQ